MRTAAPTISLSAKRRLFVAILPVLWSAVDVLRCNCLTGLALSRLGRTVELHAPPPPHPFAWPHQTSSSWSFTRAPVKA